MNNTLELSKIKKSLYTENMVDGLTEIFLGLMLIFTPFLFIKPYFVVFIGLLVLFNVKIVEFVKERITYPRLGKIDVPFDYSSKSSKRALLELGGFFSIVIIIDSIVLIIFESDLFSINDWAMSVPFLFGLIMFGPSKTLADNSGLTRYYLFGIFATILGFIFYRMFFDDIYDRIILYFMFLGICSLIFGIIKFIVFLKKYPVLNEESEAVE
jgi:hypothetical protein